MGRLAGFSITAQVRPISASICLSGLGLLACGKILGVDFDVVAEQGANTGEGMGLTSAGGADEINSAHSSSWSTVSGTGNQPDGMAVGGGQGSGGSALAGADANAAGASGADATDDSAATTGMGHPATTGGSGGEAGSHDTTDGSGGAGGHGTTDGSGGAGGYSATHGSGGEIGEPAQCSPTAPFSTIDKVRGISGAAAMAHYSHDELTVYYAVPTGSTLSFAKATRPTIDDAFGSAELVAPVNQLGFVASPSLTADGLTMYLDNNSSGTFRIYSATRDAPEQAFPVPTMVSEIVADGGLEGGPSVSASGRDLYFHASRTGNSDIFHATRTALGFQDIEKLPVSSDDYVESFPAVSPDDLTLYFLRSHVLSAPGSNTTLWRSIRSTVTESFSDAEPVTELDSPEIPVVEIADWISEDNCRFYFSRMPAAEMWPGSSLVVATRAPEAP